MLRDVDAAPASYTCTSLTGWSSARPAWRYGQNVRARVDTECCPGRVGRSPNLSRSFDRPRGVESLSPISARRWTVLPPPRNHPDWTARLATGTPICVEARLACVCLRIRRRGATCGPIPFVPNELLVSLLWLRCHAPCRGGRPHLAEVLLSSSAASNSQPVSSCFPPLSIPPHKTEHVFRGGSDVLSTLSEFGDDRCVRSSSAAGGSPWLPSCPARARPAKPTTVPPPVRKLLGRTPSRAGSPSCYFPPFAITAAACLIAVQCADRCTPSHYVHAVRI